MAGTKSIPYRSFMDRKSFMYGFMIYAAQRDKADSNG